MKIVFVWPDCDYLNLKWGSCRIDSFVIEATEEEVISQILPLTIEGRAEPGGPRPGDKFEYYLVSRDLSSKVAIAWYYPISNMWNGWSPFQFHEQTIHSLQDLQSVVIKDKDER